ncbi:MAG: 3-hydroxyacyl-CoA dehydrogenase NAD-binding domain-containing protein [Deltaproteobacteria bacterium]|nr:3-hydroxyacyl-CoA dehydrogenase NAD-binding domain-containing protein [Deltaproteobacteria bacterium]
MSPEIRKIAVVGTGIRGTQIALQAAYHRCEVTTFDIDPQSFEKMLGVIRVRIQNSERTPAPAFTQIDQSARKVKQCADLAEALRGRDLILEAVRENLGLKREVFKTLDALSPREAILATNSSSIPISRIENATARPDQCLNLHFYSLDMGKNIVDIMGGTRTSAETMRAGKRWTRSIGCVPLTVKKENLGLCFNRVWRAVKREVLHAWGEGYSDFKDIDRGWMVWNGTPAGPFGIMDNVGLDVVYDIEMVYYNESRDPKDYPPAALKAMIDRQELGVKTGKGFYTYPNPEYQRANFLKGESD